MYLNIDTNGKMLYLQIYSALKQKIITGEIKVDEKLPSIRSLSRDLNVSLNTVKKAYYQLEEEGYIESRNRAGFYAKKLDNLIILEDFEIEKQKNFQEKILYDFSFSGVDIENFPYQIWRKIFRDSIEDYDETILERVDSKGYPPLRKAISKYLKDSRGINTDYRNIIISSGTEHLFSLIKMLLKKDTLFAFENPGYAFGNKFFTYDLSNPIPISVDENGAMIESVKDFKSLCLLVTPCSQFPMGTVMSIQRRIEILNWASGSFDRFIIEDDYESEFRIKGYQIPALKSIDKNSDVIYMGSFSKLIAPALRISYMVLPDKLLKLYEEEFKNFGCPVSTFIQKATAEFILKGYFEKHINKMKGIYAKKYKITVGMLKEIKNIEIIGNDNSLTFVIKINSDLSEEELSKKFKDAGIRITSLKKFMFNKEESDKKYILGFASLTEKQIEEGIAKIREIISWN